MLRKGILTGRIGMEQRLQSYMIQEAAKYLKEKGKRIIGWTEILEGSRWLV